MPTYSPIACLTCGDMFTPQRSTARFCKDSCRYKWNTAGSARKRIPDALRFQVLERDRFRCRYCARSSADGHELKVDHVIPVAEGGPLTDPRNLVTACNRCNSGKGDLTLLAPLPPVHPSTPVIGVTWNLDEFPVDEWIEVSRVRITQREDGLYDLEAHQ